MSKERPELHPWPVLALGAMGLVAVVVVVGELGDGQRFLEVVRDARPAWLLAAVGLQASTYALEAAVWWRGLRSRGKPQPFWALYQISIVALLTSQLVPTAGLSGQVLVVRALEGRGVEHRTALGVVLLDLLGYYAGYAVSVVGALVVLAASGALPGWILGLAAGLMVIAGILSIGAFRLTSPGAHAPAWAERIRPLREALRSLTDADAELVRTPSMVAWAFAMRLGNFAADALTLWLCLRAVGQATPPWAAAAGFVVGSLGRTIGLIPGGLGTFEGSTVAALALLGVHVEPGLAATLLFRGLSFWLPMLPGLWIAREVGSAAAPELTAES